MRTFLLVFLALIAFLIANYYGRWSPAQRNFVQASHIITLTGTTSDNLIPLLERNNVLVIKFGAGGRVNGMIDTLIYLMNNPDKTIVLDGPCYSACTMLLGAPNNVLLTENTRLFFHSSFAELCKDGKISRVINERMNRVMKSVFIPEQQEWIRHNKAFTSTKFVELNTGLIRRWYWRNFISMRHAVKATNENVIAPIDPILDPAKMECGANFNRT